MAPFSMQYNIYIYNYNNNNITIKVEVILWFKVLFNKKTLFSLRKQLAFSLLFYVYSFTLRVIHVPQPYSLVAEKGFICQRHKYLYLYAVQAVQNNLHSCEVRSPFFIVQLWHRGMFCYRRKTR